jgi:hypothetical protein
MKKKTTQSPKAPRKFWKLEITPEFHEFKRLAQRHGMNSAEFVRAIPGLFGTNVSPIAMRLWMARSLRTLECIQEHMAHGSFPDELRPALTAAIADMRNALVGTKGGKRK